MRVGNAARLVEEDVDWGITSLKLGERNLLKRLGQLRPHQVGRRIIEASAIPDKRVDAGCISAEPLNRHMPSNA